MKRLLWVIAISCCIVGLAAQNIKVPFATGEWEPFTSEKLPNYGAATELVSAICKAADITPVYGFYPWARCEKTVDTGDAFASFPYAITVERKALFNYSEPLFHSYNVVFYHTKNPKTAKGVKFEKISDLKGYNIGILAGSFVATELEKNGIKYETTTTLDLSIKKLQMGRVDFIIDEQAVTYDTIKKLFPKEMDQFKSLPKPFGNVMANALIVSKKYPNANEILARFNKGLASIKKSGEYDKILKKYNMTK